MDNYYRANYDTGEIHMEEYYNDIGELYRDDGPAAISFYKNGKIDRVSYYKDGELHRDNLPALIHYNSHEEIATKHYYKEGKAHREDGPALIIKMNIMSFII